MTSTTLVRSITSGPCATTPTDGSTIRGEPDTFTFLPPLRSHAGPEIASKGKPALPYPCLADQCQLRHLSLDHAIIDPPGRARRRDTLRCGCAESRANCCTRS